ncbi:MAG: hypothetical protein HUJ66_05485, partial [Oscillospiraceae bacterium]|nr:hypothetical protein [Oscillospiraceae bacterium]
MRKRLLSFILALVLICTLLPFAAFAAGGTVYVGFTSDVHGETGNLTNWFTNLPVGSSNLQNMGYCGDYSYSSGTSYINDFKSIVSITNEKVGNNSGVYTAGNHCYSNVDGTNSALNSAFTSTTGYKRIGEAVNTDDYTIFCFGAASGDGTGSFKQDDITTLSDYLKTADKDEPIFILSHYPLHVNSWRTIGKASDVIDLLNGYPNVVFVWGHNHSQGDSQYGTIKAAGDSINYSGSSSKTINFTYLSAGAMREGNSGSGKYYGMVAAVATDGSGVTFTYYNLSGSNMGSKTVSLDGSPSVDPEPSVPSTGSVEITPTTDKPEVSAAVAVGDTLTLKVTNGSSSSSYTFTATMAD